MDRINTTILICLPVICYALWNCLSRFRNGDYCGLIYELQPSLWMLISIPIRNIMCAEKQYFCQGAIAFGATTGWSLTRGPVRDVCERAIMSL